MKAAILGTNGFLSTAIAIHFNEIGCELDMYGLEPPVNHKYNNFYKVNFTDDTLDYSTLFSSDIIIYATGAGIQSNLKENLNLIYNLNVKVPVSICNKLKEVDYKGRFVTFGSFFEMGETKETRTFTETDILISTAPAPNDYTISKRMLSRFVASYKHDFRHWHFILPTIYGKGENSLRLIPYTINAIRKNEELHFTAGDQTRQYIHVSEIPLMLELAIRKGLASGIYNVEGKEVMTVKEIVTLIHKAMGTTVPQGCFGSAGRVDTGMKHLALDGNKLYHYTGFTPSVRIIDVIDTY
ncbi:NAD(P)-dependent oxidoreductase [Prevotella sp. PCHR]|uniref:NAD(P)-dependent oxidoreductase n=2 Tax=Xylanibacter caecicola TaxID=2736294 RepID=A0ABX2B422_9BACT|nr:NAD(P)-dependent oxidoreductase [Xylanibacter caecicola]NPE25553.1 NAD(P)-dependent oxidoreductase [Xylanibacter caecicola]